MSAKNIDAVIFDFDGTICESLEVKEEAFGEIYSAYGKDISQEVMSFHRENLGVPRTDKFFHYQKNVVGEDHSIEQIKSLCKEFSDIVTEKVILAPFIKGALSFLQENYKEISLFLSSATPQEELIEIAKKKNISHFFKLIAGSPETKAAHVSDVLALGYSKERVVYVGDASQDMMAAQKTDISFIGIGRNNFPKSIQTIENLENLSISLESLNSRP
jgi:phosphoglycolate phosphatase-like HAD superfamily hydrolase